MAALRFTLRSPPEQRVDLSQLTPDRLSGQDRTSIERIVVSTTRVRLLVGDLFRVRGDDTAQIAIEGGSDRFDGVGQGMTSGSLVLDGAGGAQAGRAMRGGRLEIRGSTGPFAASGMRGGEIEIVGDAGDFLGGPLAGEVAGMAGGSVLVRGRAGARAGDRLRRGMIVIEGDAGHAPGSRMIAGTLIVCGACGPLPGYLMRRGTLVIGRPEALLPTFVAAGTPDPVFPRLFAGALQGTSRRAARLLASPLRRFLGDTAALGKGEILAAHAAV
jgi:formylmethanofuran dehydrogenase subunit C